MSRPILTADPQAGYLLHADEIRAALDRVLASGRYILGPEVEAFEREFSAFHGGGHTLGVANGTEALELALRAVGVGAEDLVATVGNTASATVAAIQQIGARAIFVEIDPATMVLAPAALETVLASFVPRLGPPVRSKRTWQVHTREQWVDLLVANDPWPGEGSWLERITRTDDTRIPR